MRTLAIMSLAGVLLLISGCSGPKKPEGFPPLVPCELLVLQDGSPLPGASIAFHEDGTMSGWSVSAHSNPQGIAIVKTHGNYTGIPAGKYILTVHKSKIVPDTDPNAVEQEKTVALVDKKYTDRETSPLKLTVDGDKPVKETIDVGKAPN